MRKVVIESKYFLNILFYDSYSFLRRSSNLVTIFNFTKKKDLKDIQFSHLNLIRHNSKSASVLTKRINFPFQLDSLHEQLAVFCNSLPIFIKIPLTGHFYPNFPRWPLSCYCFLPTCIKIPHTGHYLPAACLLLFAVDDKSSLEQVVDVFMKF